MPVLQIVVKTSVRLSKKDPSKLWCNLLQRSVFEPSINSAANITIHLTNGGQTPYKPDLYPDIIVIERRLNKEGPSPYKIKNSSGRIVSTKKEELVAILDHMNLLVNNPLTMLTQDMARKFLSDSTSEDKYKLFMHGTQLTHLQNDFNSVRESLETACTTLERKKQGLPALQAKANEAQRRLEDFSAAKEIENKIDILNNELVWSQIISKEKECKKHEQDAQVAKRQLEQIEEACEAQSEKIRTCNQKIATQNEEWEASKNLPNSDEDEKKSLMEEKAKKELIHRECKVNDLFFNQSIYIYILTYIYIE
jgi:chromosome segregation ATPase